MEIAAVLKQMTIISKTDQISSMNCNEKEKEMGWRLFSDWPKLRANN